jgi:ATP-dependent helicase/nuclease subunit A
MVGDVKQSIYRFRLAEPKLFLGKYIRFSSDGEGCGLRIDLSRNFRSRSEVLDGTNYLFRQIMDEHVGEIDYNESAELIRGARYPDDDVYPVEVAIIDQADENAGQQEKPAADEPFSQEEIEKTRLEARYLAGQIRQIIDGGKPVHDIKKGISRPAQYRDMVILLRSMTWAQEIMEEFRNAGIPVYADLSEGYFEATEVTVMLSLLKIIDNPQQDIPLAAVLRSPIVGLDEEELSQIRIASRKGSYFEALKQYMKQPAGEVRQETMERIRYFMGRLSKWRTMARSGALSDLIWQLYRETGFYEFAGGLPGGKQRQANLRALYDRASQYEETSFRGLFRFLRFIDRMRDRGKDLGTARALGEQEDVVRIMTIHSSKGLEFPIVFVAGLGRQFHTKDLSGPFLLDKDYGFASKYIHPEKRISRPSLSQLALKRKNKMEMMAEEMRILYVALTRAKEKLFLVGTVKNAEKEISNWKTAITNEKWLLKDYYRANAMTYLDWIGPSLLRHRHCGLADGFQPPGSIFEHPSRWKTSIVPHANIKPVAAEEDSGSDEWLQKVKEGKPVDVQSDYRELVFTRLAWKYPHENAAKTLSKQSVSELKRMAAQADETAGTELLSRRQGAPLFHKPKFMEQKALSPAERGTVMHTVMQHISLKEAPTMLSIEHLLDELIQKEIITAEQADAVSGEQIVRFFESELGKRMLASANVSREVPFTMGIPAREVYPDWDGTDELVIVQGVVDCLMEEADGLVLLDYKTDAITGRFPGGFAQAKDTLKNRYQMQIHIYERAIKGILKKNVKEKYLYFFDGGHAIRL